MRKPIRFITCVDSRSIVGDGFQFRSDNIPNFLKNFNRLRNVNDVILIKINVSLIIEMNNRGSRACAERLPTCPQNDTCSKTNYCLQINDFFFFSLETILNTTATVSVNPFALGFKWEEKYANY